MRGPTNLLIFLISFIFSSIGIIFSFAGMGFGYMAESVMSMYEEKKIL